MKVLFVSSGNRLNNISPIIKNQGESLKKKGCEVEYFAINGNGIWGYLKNWIKLKNSINTYKPDIIHAHYGLSGILSSLMFSHPLIVSLMGSEIKMAKWKILIINWLGKHSWNHTIVKSTEMRNHLNIKTLSVIPNGVNNSDFKLLNKLDCIKELGWDIEKKHILFAANPNRAEKNFKLALNAFKLLNNKQLELHTLTNVRPDQVPKQMNASNIILLTSNSEGSPNVIKEAMSCNRPIVATNVGDIAWLLGDEPGHFLANFNPLNVCENLSLALQYEKFYHRTNGSQRIIKLGLRSDIVAEEILSIYKKFNSNES